MTFTIDREKKQAVIVLDKQEIELISGILAETVFQGADRDTEILSDEFCELYKQLGVTG